VLTDPRETAARYLADYVGTTESTELSEFRQGDATSGEVEVSGDHVATILLRQVDGHWHVEAVVSPDYVEALEGAPGELRLIARRAGNLSVDVVDADGGVVQSMPDRFVVNGEESLVVPDAPAGTPLTVRWVLQAPGTEAEGHGTAGLGHVALVWGGPPNEHTVPAIAIWSEGGVDARAVTGAYLADRLGHSPATLGEASVDADVAEVTWEAGVVLLHRADGLWYVTEAIGDSIQIAGTSLDVGYVSGTLTLAQAGIVHLRVGDTTWDVRNDVDREGTEVRIDHEISTDGRVVLRAVFETDSGAVSVAERLIG
jgi:hypothetical protein